MSKHRYYRLREHQANGWLGSPVTRAHFAKRIWDLYQEEMFVTDSSMVVIGHITRAGHHTIYPEPRPQVEDSDACNKPDFEHCHCKTAYHPDCAKLNVTKWGDLGRGRHHPMCQWAPSVKDNWEELHEVGGYKLGWNTHESDENTKKFARIHEDKEQDKVDYILNSGKMSAQRGLEIFVELQKETAREGRMRIRSEVLAELEEAGMVDNGVLMVSRLAVLAKRASAAQPLVTLQ